MRRGDITPMELTEEAIARIEKHNGTLNAVVHKAYGPARGQAAGALPDGPFRGVPFLIKDLACKVAGMPRTSGSRFLRHEHDDEDAELARRFRAAGLVFLTGGGYTETQNRIADNRMVLDALPILFVYSTAEAGWSVGFETGAASGWQFNEYPGGDHGTSMFGAVPMSVTDVADWIDGIAGAP